VTDCVPLVPGLVARPIARGDDAAVAQLIREVMHEYRCGGPGFAVHDPEVDGMSAAYRAPGAAFFVVVDDGVDGGEGPGAVRGCGGYAPLAGGPVDTCELRKMYFRAPIRGRGAGRAFLAFLLEHMGNRAGHRRCYLETTSWMDAARHLYEAAGFVATDVPMGNTGHHGCDRHYLLELQGPGPSAVPR